MTRHTGGSAFGDTSTRSRFLSRAIFNASRKGTIPIIPSGPTSRTSLARMRSFTRYCLVVIAYSLLYCQLDSPTVPRYPLEAGKRSGLPRPLETIRCHLGQRSEYITTDPKCQVGSVHDLISRIKRHIMAAFGCRFLYIPERMQDDEPGSTYRASFSPRRCISSVGSGSLMSGIGGGESGMDSVSTGLISCTQSPLSIFCRRSSIGPAR